ncbi:hypothetical protein [Flavobacterium sp.]|uniref:hypothetical protein n=1 Tax=Flavobacterium sp. TaxID=239 RepID=UPI0025D3663C|nr:hypothetical protein [Flavobacterium sp.]
MYYLKKLLDFYIQSSIHVGLAVFSLVYLTSFNNDLCKHITYPCCVFFGTILGYNFLKYFEIFRKGKFHSLKYYGIVMVCFLAVFGFYFFFIRMINSIKIQLIIGGLMVLLYPLFRKHGIIKMFWVSFVVAYLTDFVFTSAVPNFKGILLLEFMKRFVLISALIIPFEIYDSQHDDKTLNTLPQKFGIKTAKKTGYILLFLFIVLDVLSFHFNDIIRIQYLYADITIALVTGLAVYFSSVKRNQYYTSFWVESIPILWLVLVMSFT